ncbi:MAG: dodecin domain-containing protein [Anaerolineales bacterium]|nr:MAG: dodecin domain-containing protein [Anaerolineales bacterium]
MSDRVYKLIELTGTSTKSVEDAIQTAVARASETIRHMRWFEVVEIRGSINDDQVAQWQVTLKIGFALEDDAEALD